jgi:2-oxoglutarate ferredoxin oxidoreductase subunit alpha
MLLLTEGDCDPKKLIKVLHYDGTPITAGFISGRIASAVDENKVSPIRKVAS